MEYLIEMVDGGIVEITTDMEAYGGCETCDYGSSYVNNFEVQMSNGVLYIEVDNMYEYALSEGFLMKLFLQNAAMMQEMTEREFMDWLKPQIVAEFDKNYMGVEDFTYTYEEE